MLKRGGGRDVERAAVWFIRWWREEGCALSASAPCLASDGVLFNSESQNSEEKTTGPSSSPPNQNQSSSIPPSFSEPSSSPSASLPSSASIPQRGGWGFDFQWEFQPTELEALRTSGEADWNKKVAMESMVQRKMEEVVESYAARAEDESKDGEDVSSTQVKKKEKALQQAKREKRVRELLARRRAG